MEYIGNKLTYCSVEAALDVTYCEQSYRFALSGHYMCSLDYHVKFLIMSCHSKLGADPIDSKLL